MQLVSQPRSKINFTLENPLFGAGVFTGVLLRKNLSPEKLFMDVFVHENIAHKNNVWHLKAYKLMPICFDRFKKSYYWYFNDFSCNELKMQEQ